MPENKIRQEKALKGRKALVKGYRKGFHKLTFKELDQALTTTAKQIEKIKTQREKLGKLLLAKQQSQSKIWKGTK
jgi:hypothetical protein